jgi:hypothetical protein
MREGLQAILTERGPALADVPGGAEACNAKDYRGKDLDTPVYKVDGGSLCYSLSFAITKSRRPRNWPVGREAATDR